MGAKVCIEIVLAPLIAPIAIKIYYSRFIDFMKNFSSPTMDIGFTAERSVQDAIEELSEGESLTVIISYIVMFLYVALALGKLKGFKKFLVGVDFFN